MSQLDLFAPPIDSNGAAPAVTAPAVPGPSVGLPRVNMFCHLAHPAGHFFRVTGNRCQTMWAVPANAYRA